MVTDPEFQRELIAKLLGDTAANIDNLIANGGGLLGLPVPSQEILP